MAARLRALVALAILWTGVAATVEWSSATGNYTLGGPANGTIRYCCVGSVLGGGYIFTDPRFENMCYDLPGAGCSSTQQIVNEDCTQPLSGDGCCWFCSVNECQWQLQEWTWKCYDCPKGYQSTQSSPCQNASQSVAACAKCPSSKVKLQYSETTGYRCMDNCKPSNTSCEFYKCLDDNYNGCGSTGYPLAYGYPYCEKYAHRAKYFSPQGQEWIKTVRLCLQNALLNDTTNPDETCDQLASNAFGSHADCYVNSGICDIPQDWGHILATIGYQPWIHEFLETLTETLETEGGCEIFLAWQAEQFAKRKLLSLACSVSSAFGATSYCPSS